VVLVPIGRCRADHVRERAFVVPAAVFFHAFWEVED